MPGGSEVRFANMDRSVPRLREQTRQGHSVGPDTSPTPLRRTERASVVRLRTNPLGGAMARRVLPGDDRRRSDGGEVVGMRPVIRTIA